MTHNQHPLGSGFTAASTTADVLEGIDLTGRTAVVTGGHVGLGLETTRALSAAGATVVVGSRSPDRAAAALTAIDGVEVEQLDLLDPVSVDAFANRFRDSGRPLHMLINNAGIMGGPRTLDPRGYEAQFATNHLGHFQLTLGLFPALRDANGARVVNVSSGGHHYSDIRWDDLHFETGPYDGMLGYGQSKTANILFGVELDRRWAGDGIRGYSLHPGVIFGTNLAPWLTDDELRRMGLVDDAGEPILDPEREMKTPQQGAATSVWAATSPLLDGVGGVYLKNCDVAPVGAVTALDTDITAGPQDSNLGVAPYAVDPEAAQRLWALSEELIRASGGG
nr:oxidoreductase [Mycolicibacterium baixiangningiae]